MKAPDKIRHWRKRIGLFNARAAAFLFEVLPIQLIGAVACGPVIAQAIRHYDPWTRERGELIGATTAIIVHAGVDLLWFLMRDAIPGLTWGKKLMGLRVVRQGTDAPAAVWSRIVRNSLLFIPFFVVVEGLCSLLDARDSRRIGDWIGGTRVRHSTDPSGDHGLHLWPLAVALILYACCIASEHTITEYVFHMAFD
ncbi:MAG: RDD family protein [Planctomycetes bacterium]|nr:RDD family protein [Planctomycetota bacterium]